MANRVTEADVEAIIEVDSSIDVDVFITTANTLIAEILDGAGYSEAYLTEIEKYLSAHLVSLRQRQLTGQKFGDADEKYAGKFGMGLEFTQYGQFVLNLDTSGRLKKSGKPKVEFIAL